MQQTMTRRWVGGANAVAAVLVSILASLVLTAATAQAAWADTSKIEAGLGVEPTSKASNSFTEATELNLKAKMTDFTYDGQKLLSGGWGMVYSDTGLASTDFQNVTVQWYVQEPGESAYEFIKSTSVGDDGWNSMYNYPSSSTVYATGTRTYDKAGTYNVYCVVKDGDDEVSPHLEYTVTIESGSEGPEPVETFQNVTIEVSPEDIAPIADVDLRQDSRDGDQVFKNFMDVYEVAKGHTYYLTVSCDGYDTVEKTFEVAADAADEQTIAVTLAKTAPVESGDFTLSIADGIENGTITATIDHNGVTQTTKFSGGDTITVTAVPAEGYVLDELTFPGVFDGYTIEYADDRSSATVEIDRWWDDYGNGDLTIGATFKSANAPKYAVAVAEIEGGTFKADAAECEAGEDVYFSVVPAQGYALVEKSVKLLKADGTESDVSVFGPFNNRGSFEMPAYDVTITGAFELASYRIQIPDFDNGTVESDVATAKMGDTVTLTATPAEGYVLDTLSVKTTTMDSEGNVSEVPLTTGADGTYTFTMPGDMLIVSASFKEAPAIDPADQAAADAVIQMINELPESDKATADTKAAADAAKEAYGKLTEAQQALVDPSLVEKMNAVSTAADKAKEEADKASQGGSGEGGESAEQGGKQAQAAPAAQTIAAKNASKTIKAKKLKKKAQKVNAAKLAKVSAKTQLTFTGKANKKAGKFKIAKNGVITVKKGLKKGTYKIKMTATAAATSQYAGATKTFTVKIKVK